LKIVILFHLFYFYNTSAAGVEYKVTYSIADLVDAGSESSQFVMIHGNKGNTSEYMCSQKVDFDVINQDVSCVFESGVDIGDYLGISLRTGGYDGLDLTKVIHS
jgi:hypothetical protein